MSSSRLADAELTQKVERKRQQKKKFKHELLTSIHFLF